MKALKKTILLFIISISFTLFQACSIEPQDIEYGTDACDYCRMTIVEQTHGAELVTKKGKVYKYDAIECLIQHKREFDQETIKFLLMTDYANPQHLIPMEEGTIIQSKAVPSPMGAFLSGFKSEEQARKLIEEKGGKILEIDELEKIL
jgi:copper chaperone NosL